MEWINCSKKLPEFNHDKEYDRMNLLITIPQSKGLRTVAAQWVRTTVRGKRVERWEWNDRICPWVPIHWMNLPQPPQP